MQLLLRSWSSWFIIPGGPPPTAWTKAAAVVQFLFREVHIWYPLIIDGSCVDICDVKSPGCHLELWYSCCTISVRNTWTQRRCSHTPINLPHSNQYDTPELSVVLQHIFSNISNLMTQWTNMCWAKRLQRLKLIGVNMSMFSSCSVILLFWLCAVHHDFHSMEAVLACQCIIETQYLWCSFPCSWHYSFAHSFLSQAWKRVFRCGHILVNVFINAISAKCIWYIKCSA